VGQAEFAVALAVIVAVPATWKLSPKRRSGRSARQVGQYSVIAAAFGSAYSLARMLTSVAVSGGRVKSDCAGSASAIAGSPGA
jgi:hypothetical protein